MTIRKIVFIFISTVLTLSAVAQKNSSKQTKSAHPRIYITDQLKEEFKNNLQNVDWKNSLIEKKKKNLEKYMAYCEKDPQWLVSRLQMNWKTKHSNVYLRGGNFAYSDGKAPVPTVRFSGTRDWATKYKTPKLENVEPFFDDARGFYLERKDNSQKEWVKPLETGHMIESVNENIMSLVEDAAFLYWLTGDEKYAKFAAPVFKTYVEGMYYRNPPVVIDNSEQKNISGLATFEVIHEKIVVSIATTYDFMFNYFKKNKLDQNKSVAVLQKWGDQIIKYGVPDNNWNLFQARFLTYIAIALDNDQNYANGKGQQYYLKNTFDVSSIRQIALKESLLVYDQENGMWPECPSYSMHVNGTLLEIMTLLDNYTHTNELSNYPIIEKASLACFQYLFPNDYTVGFGDAGHNQIPFENLELLVANYQKYNQKEKELPITALLNKSINAGEYSRKATDLFELFFYANDLSSTADDQNIAANLSSPTFYAPNVSWLAQRLGTGDKAIMLSTVGSYGNHAHANGIAIELYANKYVLGPDMGKGDSYWSPNFLEYYSQMPAHNTVVVDGKSTYGSMRSYHPYSLENSYPLSGEMKPAFKQVAFSKVSFVEPKTQSDQQRLSAIINTASGDGYVLDIFRSKKKDGGTERHEYFYHNLGQSLQIFENNNELPLKSSAVLGTKNGDMKAYDYLSDEKSIVNDNDISAVFKLTSSNSPANFMKMWIKGQAKQSIFSVLAPKSNAICEGTAPKEVLDNKMATLILRREQAAWKNPFVVVFNPYVENGNNPVKNVTFSKDDSLTDAQMITVTHANNITSDNIVATSTVNDVVSTADFYQKGLFSVFRTNNKNAIPEFIFTSGMIQYKYKDWEILTCNEAATVSIELQGKTLLVQNSQPIVLKVPFFNGFNALSIRMYSEDGSFVEKEATLNRSNPNQLEFRLSKAYKKAIVILE